MKTAAPATRTAGRVLVVEDERDVAELIRYNLAKEGYDVREEQVMYNEMQAYLMFTRDPTLFAVDMVEMTQDRLTTLQGRFLAGMPAGWLRNALAGYQDPRSAQ